MLGEIALIRRQHDTDGEWSGGTYTPGDYREIPIRGTWRPMPAIQVQLLESGDRQRDPRVLYTTAQLLPTDQHSNQPPDLISPDGGATYYEVISEYEGDDTAPGFSRGVRHRKYACLRQQEEDG
jgi:hypothetical protein